MLKLGYKASAEQFAPNPLLGFAVAADEAGFHSVFVSDHFQPFMHTDGHAPFSMSWLAAAGARTARTMLGTSVLTPTFRYHPTVVAHAFATMASMFDGRMILGVGSGEALNDVPAIGCEWPKFAERSGRMIEAIHLMRRLWTEERVSHEGTYYRTVNATIYDRPASPVPIYVSAGGPKAARLAGAVCDGFICTSGKPASLYNDALLPNLRDGLAQSGRTVDDIDMMIEIKLSYDRDPDMALQNCRHWAPLALTADEKASVEDPVELERLAAAMPIERAASRWIVASTPQQVVDGIAPYVDMGFRHLVFHAPGREQLRFIDQFSQEVAPMLHEAFGTAPSLQASAG